jgi:hypothetical protein
MIQNGGPKGEELGYFFYPRSYPHAPGHPRLDITIPQTPTGRHFDPMTVRLLVRARSHITSVIVETIRIHHPWPYESEFQACTGRIIIEDRHDKVVEAFTLGGNLNIVTKDTATKCILESSAPILELIDTNLLVISLVDEIEILLAERRAYWLPTIKTYEQRLVNISPLDLYTACLETLRQKYAQSHRQDEESYQLVHFISDEIGSLKKQCLWPDKVPTITEIL